MTRVMHFLIVLLLTGTVGGSPGVAAGGGKDDGGSKAKEIEIVRLKPIVIQLPGAGRLRRSIAITMSLEIGEAGTREKIVEARPKLRARIFEAWSSPPLARDGEERIDPAEARQRAQKVSDYLYGEGVVANVLIGDIHEILIP